VENVKQVEKVRILYFAFVLLDITDGPLEQRVVHFVLM